jgi:hypothetical protein
MWEKGDFMKFLALLFVLVSGHAQAATVDLPKRISCSQFHYTDIMDFEIDLATQTYQAVILESTSVSGMGTKVLGRGQIGPIHQDDGAFTFSLVENRILVGSVSAINDHHAARNASPLTYKGVTYGGDTTSLPQSALYCSWD